MVSEGYVPKRGDLVWLKFNPQTGHEQSGSRPAIAISPEAYNRRTGLGLFCPVTSKEKGYPFEVRLIKSKTEGVILADQIKSLDWRARKARFIERVGAKQLEEVLEKLSAIIIPE